MAYTKNRVPHKTLQGKTPIEVFLQKDPIKERANLRPFGQKVICYDYEVTDKLSARSYEARIIGYTQTFGTYWVRKNDGSYKLAKSPTPVIEEPESDTEDEEEPEPESPEPPVSENEKPVPMAPKRKRNLKNDEYWDSVVGRRSSTRERKPTAKVQAVGADLDHPTDEQARNSPLAAEWAKARIKEREQLEKYGVFTKIDKADIPKGSKIVDTKWVYTIKRKLDGSIEKYKARKVGRGFSQEEGVSYDVDQTFAQMMRPETFKILLVIALHRNWAIRQWDVVAAYLQALLHYDIYISDINENGETEYWKLHKALYGLKQAGHEWYQTLKEILRSAGLERCLGDEGTYVSASGDQIIGTHVDDLIGIAPEESTLDRIEQSIEKTVELEKSGRPTKNRSIKNMGRVEPSPLYHSTKGIMHLEQTKSKPYKRNTSRLSGGYYSLHE